MPVLIDTDVAIIVMNKIGAVWYNMRHETQTMYTHQRSGSSGAAAQKCRIYETTVGRWYKRFGEAGEAAVHGGNVWLMDSIPPFSRVYDQTPFPRVKTMV